MVKGLFAAAVLFVASISAHADTLVGYWDLNSTLNRSAGTSGSLSVVVAGLGVEYIGWGTGSDKNLVDGYTPGQSLQFTNLATVVEVGHITLSNLNFTNLVNPVISFAAKSNPGFQLSDTFTIDYWNGSQWVSSNLDKPTTSYEIISHRFSGGELDGVANASIRISFSTVVAVVDTMNVDNIQVNAVPEPGTLALAGMGLAGAFILWRRRR